MSETTLGKNAIYKVILNICNILIPIFVGPYINGLIFPEMLGIYNSTFVVFQVFLSIGTFGIYSYGVRELNKYRHDKEKFSETFSNLFIIGVISNLIIIIIYVIFFLHVSTGITRIVYITMIIQLVGNMIYVEFMNEAVENYRFISIKTILVRILFLISIFLFVKKPTDIVIYSIVISLTVFLNNLASFIYVKKRVPFRFKKIEIVRHLKPLFITMLFVNVEMLYAQLDRLMLKGIEVTEYNNATLLTGMLWVVPLSLVNVAIPRLAAYIGEEKERQFEETLEKTVQIYFAIALPIFIGVAVLSKEIMWLYTQDVYTYAYPVLLASALSRIIYAYQSLICNLIMYVLGMENAIMIFLAIFGVCNYGMNVYLVKNHSFSPLTALISTTIALTAFCIVGIIYVKRKTHLKIRIFSKRIAGYFLICLSFFIVTLICKNIGTTLFSEDLSILFKNYKLNVRVFFNIFTIMPICIILYYIYLRITKDPVILEFLKLLPVKRKREI